MDDDKYVVFKKEDFNEWVRLVAEDDSYAPHFLTEHVVPDAVVIRRQDIFAASALYGYAHAVRTVHELLTYENSEFQTSMFGQEMDALADYFFQQAEIAQSIRGKVPD